MSDETKDKDMELVRKACEQLSEHFDTVQIFVTRHEAGEHDGTVNINFGSGNYFARSGQVREWIVRRDHFARKESSSE